MRMAEKSQVIKTKQSSKPKTNSEVLEKDCPDVSNESSTSRYCLLLVRKDKDKMERQGKYMSAST